MQFNSYIFIMAFLPLFFAAYFLAGKFSIKAAKAVIIGGSILFYLYGGISLAFILGISIVFNYIFSCLLRRFQKKRRILLVTAVLINISLLFYFKYFNFFLSGLNDIFHTDLFLSEIALPLGISFFTFQQIMYLVNISEENLTKTGLVDYLTYILYFPKLVMGPLTEPSLLLNQFDEDKCRKPDFENIACGLRIFALGLFKKVILADMFAKVVTMGFGDPEVLTSGDVLLLMLSYTFEIYFDFSGYSDMAVGVSTMLNIDLPMNFDSPYKALSVRDFWKRWHISLTSFLTKYIYFPLGGSRRGNIRTYVNTMIVFLISGIWHGANWTFIFWGILHGAFSVLDRLKMKVWDKILKPVRWLMTFIVINILWLLFAASDVSQWAVLTGRLFSFSDMSFSPFLTSSLPDISGLLARLGLQTLLPSSGAVLLIAMILVSILICLIPQNNYRKLRSNSLPSMMAAALCLLVSLLFLSGESVFVYYNF